MMTSLKRIFSRETTVPSVESPPMNGDGLIWVSPQSLVALRQVAESVPLWSSRVRSMQGGGYRSPFKGRGMEFDEVRPYQPGDDVRTLDWRVTARSGKPHTKLFREERERPVLLWTDLRASMFFATRGAFKSVIAARTAAILAWSSLHHGDRLGGLVFSTEHHRELRPERGKAATVHFIKQLCEHPVWQQAQSHQPEQDTQSILQAAARLRRVARPGSLIFLISDFRHMDKQTEAHLSELARHNDVVLIFISDPLEMELPPPGDYRLSDGEQEIVLDSRNVRVREAYRERFQQHVQRLKQLCWKHHIHFLPCSTSDNLTQTLRQGLGLAR